MMTNKSKLSIERYVGRSRKNIVVFLLEGTTIKTEIAEIAPGEFPIEAWGSFPLEVPETGFKKDMGGRIPSVFGLRLESTKWDNSRIVSIPRYKKAQKLHPKTVKRMLAPVKKGSFPENIPTVTLAVRTCGCYCDERRAQGVSVLPTWSDGTAVLLELDWCEGAAEDCVNPEWYLKASERLELKDGLHRLRQSCARSPSWEGCSFFLYFNPSFLGDYLLGRGRDIPNRTWQREWKYSEHETMMNGLDQVIDRIWGLSLKCDI